MARDDPRRPASTRDIRASDIQTAGTPPPEFAPEWRWTWSLAAFALAVRLAVLVATLMLAPPGTNPADLARLHDGREYQQVALDRARTAGVEPTGLAAAGETVTAHPSRETERLAPGYPLLILAGSWLLPIHGAALALSLLGAALATGALHRLGLSPPTVAVVLLRRRGDQRFGALRALGAS